MKYYIVDAFTRHMFKGNPAGVLLVDAPMNAALMQNIAAENNLSETAFLTKRDGYFDLRWFTPSTEIGLCGHATLASGFVVLNFVYPEAKQAQFRYAGGTLNVLREGETYFLDFPSYPPSPCPVPENLSRALGGAEILETHKGHTFIAVVKDERTLASIVPDFSMIGEIKGFETMAVTAPGDVHDFVSRCFAPAVGIPEDPVTGSTHTSLIPFWSKRLGKTELTAFQCSQRGGELFCADRGERVKIGGYATLYLQGSIQISTETAR